MIWRISGLDLRASRSKAVVGERQMANTLFKDDSRSSLVTGDLKANSAGCTGRKYE
jgi:hypothetical protein